MLAVAVLALAAAQPVVASHDRSSVERYADVFVVIDTSRSMLASVRAGAPTRFERARAAPSWEGAPVVRPGGADEVPVAGACDA